MHWPFGRPRDGREYGRGLWLKAHTLMKGRRRGVAGISLGNVWERFIILDASGCRHALDDCGNDTVDLAAQRAVTG